MNNTHVSSLTQISLRLLTVTGVAATLALLLGLALFSASPAAAASGGQVNGIVWVDANGDGVRAGDETQNLAFVTIALTDHNGALVGAAASDAQGRYQISGLPPGLYQIGAQSASGLVASTPTQRWIAVSETTAAVADFGFVTPTMQALVSFSVTTGAPFIEIMWRTGNEDEVQNFNLYRSAPDGSGFTLLNQAPIQPHGSTHPYSWYDATAAPGAYTYWLEFNYADGPVVFGPRSASISTTIQHIFLPRIAR